MGLFVEGEPGTAGEVCAGGVNKYISIADSHGSRRCWETSSEADCLLLEKMAELFDYFSVRISESRPENMRKRKFFTLVD